jgi:hypothetical protein
VEDCQVCWHLDNVGAEVGILRQLVCNLLTLTQENSRLCKHLESLSAGISAQGGVVLDGLGFISEAQVRVVVLAECSKGDAFEVFLDSMSLFCCNPSNIPVTSLA